MPWKCLSCRLDFQGPVDRAPDEGCPACGSRQVIDINAEPVRVQKVHSLGSAPLAPPLIRKRPTRPAPAKSALLVRELYDAASRRNLKSSEARDLFRRAADEIQKLQQLPLL